MKVSGDSSRLASGGPRLKNAWPRPEHRRHSAAEGPESFRFYEQSHRLGAMRGEAGGWTRSGVDLLEGVVASGSPPRAGVTSSCR